MDNLLPGDIIELMEGHVVNTMIPAHFLFADHKGDWELWHHDVTIAGEFAYLAGRYVVVEAHWEDSGEEMGRSAGSHWHVWCQRIKDKLPVDFPQYRIDAQPVGKARLTWLVEEGDPS